MALLRTGLSIFFFLTITAICPGPGRAEELRWPLDRPRHITGTFCEPRGFRFHMGLDVSCGGLKGFAVRAADDGYVSTVMYQKWGIGYALFITHPNGTRSFYGHLDGFSPLLLSAGPVKAHYRNILDRLDFTVDPDKKAIPVKRGTVVGYTGDTGIGKEHFHFELRDRDNVNLNPLTHGITVPDNRPPVLSALYLRPLDPYSHVNGSSSDYYAKIMPLKGQPGRYALISGVMPVAAGAIGVKVKMHDFINYTRKVAVYRIEMHRGEKKVYEARFDRMSREDNTRLGLYFDLDRTRSSAYTHNLYLRDSGEGIIRTGKAGEKIQLTVRAGDAAGNISQFVFTLTAGTPFQDPAYGYRPNLRPGRSLRMKSRDGDFSLSFERDAAYYDEMVSLSESAPIRIAVPGLTVKSPLYMTGPTDLCLKNTADILLNYRGEDAMKTGLFQLDPGSNRFYFISNQYDPYRGRFKARTHRMGGYFLVRDDAPPRIRYRGPVRVKPGHRFRFTVSDIGLGINLDRVHLTVDGKPVHWDYDPDYSRIEILPHSPIWAKGGHVIRLQLEDLAGNRSKPFTGRYTI